MQLVATVACIAAILGLFFLDRESRAPTSKALWLPVIWFLIIGSRPVSDWFQTSTGNALATQLAEGSPADAALY